MNTWSSFVNRKAINESNVVKLTREDMIDTIKAAIENPEIATNDLFDAYNAFMKKYIPEAVTPYFEVRGINDCANQIIPILRNKSEDTNILIDIIAADGTTLPASETLAKDNEDVTTGNIFKEFMGLGFSPEFLKSIALINKSSAGIGRGYFEVLLCLLLKDIANQNLPVKGAVKCDINCETRGIELKGEQSRICGHSGWNITAGEAAFNEYLNEKNIVKQKFGNGVFSSNKQIKKNREDINNDEVWKNAMIAAIHATYSIDDLQSVEGGKKKNIKEFSANEKTEIDNFLDTALNTEKPNMKLILAAISLYVYYRIEQFQYIMFINNDGTYAVFNMDKIATVDKLSINIDKYLKLKTSPSGAGQSSGVQIDCVK